MLLTKVCNPIKCLVANEGLYSLTSVAFKGATVSSPMKCGHDGKVQMSVLRKDVSFASGVTGTDCVPLLRWSFDISLGFTSECQIAARVLLTHVFEAQVRLFPRMFSARRTSWLCEALFCFRFAALCCSSCVFSEQR
jgi:hypothetical protein